MAAARLFVALPAVAVAIVESVGVAVTFVNAVELARVVAVVSSWEIWVPMEESAVSLL